MQGSRQSQNYEDDSPQREETKQSNSRSVLTKDSGLDTSFIYSDNESFDSYQPSPEKEPADEPSMRSKE